MDIQSICVCSHSGGGFWHSAIHGQRVVKTLPVLSVVQSLRGSYRLSLEDGPTYDTGTMGVFVAPSQVSQHITHLSAEDGRMDAQWVFMDVEINRLYKLDDLYTFPTVLPSQYNEEINSLISTVRTEPDFLVRLPALHRLVAILLENAIPKTQIHEEAIRLKNYVENHYMHDATTESLAQDFHCSRSTIYRLFHQYFGEAPSRYVNRVRIQHAQLLLMNTDMSVSEIATAVGFPSVSYFSRLFRQVTGDSARTYRDRNPL